MAYVLENPMVGEMQREIDRSDTSEAELARAHGGLMRDFIDAAPDGRLMVPGYLTKGPNGTRSKAYICEIEMTTEIMEQLIRVAMDVDAGSVTVGTRLIAQAAISTLAKSYADSHAEKMVG